MTWAWETSVRAIGRDAVLLVDTPQQADRVAKRCSPRSRARDKRILAAVRTLRSVLPKDQEEKLQILVRIRDKIDRYRKLMSDEEWADLRLPTAFRTASSDSP